MNPRKFPSILVKPELLPDNENTGKEFQDANRNFWEGNPMRYDWHKGVSPTEFSKEFYEEIDSRFFSAVAEFLPWKTRPFEQLMLDAGVEGKDVLEIGTGNGSHAELLTQIANSYTGIDLTDYAVHSTTTRLRIKSLPGRVLQMDAEHLAFSDNEFDVVWSWGVVHHSSDTGAVINQIVRVLKPGGRAMLMVYYRGWWNYYFTGVLFWIFRGGLMRQQSLHQAIQSNTDGAIARYYTLRSWREFIAGRLTINRCWVTGPKSDLLPMPRSRLKNFIRSCIPGRVSRFMTCHLKMGGFLICELSKPF